MAKRGEPRRGRGSAPRLRARAYHDASNETPSVTRARASRSGATPATTTATLHRRVSSTITSRITRGRGRS